MKLAEALINSSSEQLNRLAQELVRTEVDLATPLLCNTLDGVIRNFRYVQDLLYTRRPPTFAILSTLLDTEGFSLPADGLRENADIRTRRLCNLVADGSILHRADGLRLYRRVLFEARRNAIEIDASESAILGVLRRELGILHVEHFLVEHHSDLHEFWRADDAFDRELRGLSEGGLLFSAGGAITLPEDLVAL